MDYERIQKRNSNTTHQGNAGALSPRKLRSMLLGVEDKIKKNKHHDQEIAYSLRSQVSQTGDSGGCFSDECKDVDVVSVQPEYSSSTANDRKNDNSLVKSSLKSQDEFYTDYDYMSVPSPIFEFPKRGPLASFSKPAPSKWDDAQKWIASPTSNRTKGGGVSQGHTGSKKISNFGFGSRKPVTKVVVEEVPDQRFVPFEEPDTKRIDCCENNNKNGCKPVGGREADTSSIPESYKKEVVELDDCVAGSAINLSHDDISAPFDREEATFVTPLSKARSVSMRDMGTEMTPIASEEPSRNGTPVRATTPLAQSPTTSRSSTSHRIAPASSLIATSDLNEEVSEKELQLKTRREIMALGTRLGKTNITAWANKEEETNDASTKPKNVGAEERAKGFIDARATAWEEAEKAKYIARFKREEIKIQAWENHEKAKAEAEMRKMEAKVERLQGRAHDHLMNKLSDTKRKAEEKELWPKLKESDKMLTRSSKLSAFAPHDVSLLFVVADFVFDIYLFLSYNYILVFVNI